MATSVTSVSSGTPAIPSAAPQLTPTEQRYLSTITDPEQRAVERLKILLSREQPTGPNLSPNELSLLSKIKDPAERSRLEQQMRARHAGASAPAPAMNTRDGFTSSSASQLSAFEQQYLGAIRDPQEREAQRQRFVQSHELSARGETPPPMTLSWPPANAASGSAAGGTGSAQLSAFEQQYLKSISDPQQREAMRQRFVGAHDATARGETPEPFALPWPPGSAAVLSQAEEQQLSAISDPQARAIEQLKLQVARENPRGARLSATEMSLLSKITDPNQRTRMQGELIARRAPQGLSPFTPTEQALMDRMPDLKERATIALQLMAKHVNGARPLSAADKALLGHIRDPQQRALTQLQLTVQSAG